MTVLIANESSRTQPSLPGEKFKLESDNQIVWKPSMQTNVGAGQVDAYS